MVLSKKEKQWLIFLNQRGIIVNLLFSEMDGELYLTPIVNNEDLGTFAIDSPDLKLSVFKYTKMLYRVENNLPLNRIEQILFNAETEIQNKVKYFTDYIEVHEVEKVGQLPSMLLSFGYKNITKEIGNLSISQPIGYMGVDHKKKIFSFFNFPQKNTIGKLYRIKNALYFY